MAFGRRAEIDELDAIRPVGNRLKILLDVLSRRELAVGAGTESELRVGTGKSRRFLSGDETRDEREGEQDGACAHAPSYKRPKPTSSASASAPAARARGHCRRVPATAACAGVLRAPLAADRRCPIRPAAAARLGGRFEMSEEY